MSPVVDVRLDPARPDRNALCRSFENAAVRLGVDIGIVDGVESVVEVGRDRVTLPPPPVPVWRLEAALLHALDPRHVLFLCVANSARSQMAEGIARSLAPAGVKISSAGSRPTSVRPEAVRVLSEIGIDVPGQRATGLDEVERPVDAVVTLCSEEVCPVWLGDAWRLHWGLPDPAALEGEEEDRLSAFRSVRDELRRRLGALFAPGRHSPLA